jgi:hypothetical protein
MHPSRPWRPLLGEALERRVVLDKAFDTDLSDVCRSTASNYVAAPMRTTPLPGSMPTDIEKI